MKNLLFPQLALVCVAVSAMSCAAKVGRTDSFFNRTHKTIQVEATSKAETIELSKKSPPVTSCYVVVWLEDGAGVPVPDSRKEYRPNEEVPLAAFDAEWVHFVFKESKAVLTLDANTTSYTRKAIIDVSGPPAYPPQSAITVGYIEISQRP